ncbi:MoxR-like ATPase [Sulfurivirga caldicuralii]|uniref:MoxR-like ATPase n=1 Tax=Sulfurivirga caldicuralii TaxID=364032 RepID=A0A1N6HDF9_9GAMM|nr:MoxR family ATPase [Sulfurivirga caldicuralii]SIO17864.1 MoxR-like ATPase [Sulfurivirga caldicuralii]
MSDTLRQQFEQLRTQLSEQVIGQAAMVDRMIIALLAGGHVLLEGPPGLAKTTAVKALAAAVHARFQRIQFTPDLMPSDLTGSEIIDPETHELRFVPGPLFHEMVLADEINRAPPKVQAALLEAMAEHQITAGGETRPLPELFMVLATQNPLENAGTYPLPEAQLDRFMFHVKLDYPDEEAELAILRLDRARHFEEDAPLVDSDQFEILPAQVLAARKGLADIHIAEPVERYLVSLVVATRDPERYDAELEGVLAFGASPRATLALMHAAAARAWLDGRDYVIPDDIMMLAPDVLRHRIALSHKGRATGWDKDRLIAHLLDKVPVPVE